MGAGLVDLAEDVFDTDGVAVDVDGDVGAVHVEQGDHLGHVFGDLEGVDVTGRLERVGTFFGPPVVLEVVPTPAEGERVDRAGVAVPRQDSRSPHPQDVHEIALACPQQQRSKLHVLGLRDPQPLLTVEVQRPESDEVLAHPVRLGPG